jgi:hypothetical protein
MASQRVTLPVIMNYSLIIVPALLLAVISTQAHHFTDIHGNSVEAEIVAVTPADQVILATVRGELTVAIAELVEADRQLIEKWRKQNPDKMRLNLRFQVFRDKIDQKGSASSRIKRVDYDEKLRTIPRLTSLSVYNRGPGAISGLRIVVHTFVEDFVDTDKGDYRKYSVGERATVADIKQYRGEVMAEAIRDGGRVDIDYNFDLHYYVDRDGGRVDESARDRYVGLWVRAYYGEALAGEYKKELHDRMRGAEWDDATPFKLENVSHKIK